MAGVYPVALQVYNAGGYNSTLKTGYITITIPSAPIVEFTANVTNGEEPLSVSFTDISSNYPTGWAWYFGDETFSTPWTQMTTSAEWSARSSHTSAAMLDGSIILMGGYDGSGYKNDVWRSSDKGETWTQVNAGAGWSERILHSSVAMPDGSIVLMGGYAYDDNDYINIFYNDTWRSLDEGETWTQVNTSPGWSERAQHTSVAMPDGSIVLMGGEDAGSRKNDTWRSTDNGATWTQMNASAGWSARYRHTSVAMPDGSIVLMGGVSGSDIKNDTWRSTDYGATWTQITASAGWLARGSHSSVVMPDSSIILMGGVTKGGIYKNDTWRSTDYGATWTLLPDAGWTGRHDHSSVAMPDGNIVLMGGWDNSYDSLKNDVWRFQTVGSSEQSPTHTYTQQGAYQVALQVYHAGGTTARGRPGTSM